MQAADHLILYFKLYTYRPTSKAMLNLVQTVYIKKDSLCSSFYKTTIIKSLRIWNIIFFLDSTMGICVNKMLIRHKFTYRHVEYTHKLN